MIAPQTQAEFYNFQFIGILNLFVLFLTALIVSCIHKEIFITMCYEHIILFYILIITNICTSIYIYVLLVYLCCNQNTIYRRIIYYVIQTSEFIIILYNYIIFFATNKCFNMELHKDNIIFYDIVRNTYIFVLFLCALYVIFFICILLKIL